MLWKNTSERYGIISQLVHWLSVLLVGIAWALGLLGDELPKGEARELGETIHISAGELIGALLIIRLLWLMVSRPPKSIALPIGSLAKYAAKTVHIMLYILLLGVVASGITVLLAEGEALSIFDLYEIASPWAKDRSFAHNMKEFHELLAHSLIIIATIHAGAALVHHFIYGDDTLKRILPLP